jgi:hypothetical protein
MIGGVMRRLALTIGTLALVAASVATATADSRLDRSLRMLAPSERLIQLCDYTAMDHVRKESAKYRPDRAVADATAQVRKSGNTLDVSGGAFRSRGKWYGIAYRCAATPDNMKVLSFSYKVGSEIPQSKWASYGLWQ